MKSLSELTDYYYKTLYPVLEELENERAKLKKHIINIAIIYTVVFVFLAFLLLKNIHNAEAYVFSAIAYIAIGGGIYKYLIKDYTAQFKALSLSHSSKK